MLHEGTGRDVIKQNSAKVKCSEHMTPGRSLDTDGIPTFSPLPGGWSTSGKESRDRRPFPLREAAANIGKDILLVQGRGVGGPLLLKGVLYKG